MAKSQKSSNGILEGFGVVSDKDMKAELSELRSGKGGRESKYQPVAEEIEKSVTKTKPARWKGGQTEVTGLRSYLDRAYPGKYTVTSAKLDDKPAKEAQYRIFISLAEPKEETEETEEEAEAEA